MIKTMTKKPLREEMFYFILQLSPPTEGSQGREPEAETEAEAEKQYFLIYPGLVFFIKWRPTYNSWHCSQWTGINHYTGKCPMGQSVLMKAIPQLRFPSQVTPSRLKRTSSKKTLPVSAFSSSALSGCACSLHLSGERKGLL